MTSILEEFACGNVSPEPHFFKRGSRYGRAMDALLKDEEKMLAALNENEKELFKKYCDSQSEVSRLSGIDRIIVYEPEQARGDRRQKVEIVYNNIGAVDRLALMGLGA